jgi:hypothetical protein
MKLFTAILLCTFLLAGVVFAAAIDGKWVSVRKVERDGQSFTITQTYELKADGEKLTGTVATSFGEMQMKTDILNGKLDGNSFSFTTVVSTPNGEFKMEYKGAVEGDMLKGAAGREGGQGRPFEAKRQ